MDVIAYDINSNYNEVELGSISDGIAVDKLKRGQDRSIQPAPYVNAAYPAFFDRLQTKDSFGFQAAQSFETVGEGNINWLTWPNHVPRLAHLSFSQDGEILWVPFAAIQKVDLVEKIGARVIWYYTLAGGGAPSEQKPW